MSRSEYYPIGTVITKPNYVMVRLNDNHDWLVLLSDGEPMRIAWSWNHPRSLLDSVGWEVIYEPQS